MDVLMRKNLNQFLTKWIYYTSLPISFIQVYGISILFISYLSEMTMKEIRWEIYLKPCPYNWLKSLQEILSYFVCSHLPCLRIDRMNL